MHFPSAAIFSMVTPGAITLFFSLLLAFTMGYLRGNAYS